MERAKQAVTDFMSKAGKHDTTVHENVAPAVTKQTVNPERREQVTTAIDKEVHQDHYHTSVQPVHDREVLLEKHHHNLAAVEHREYHHGNDVDIARKLEQERAKFKDERIQGETKHTQVTVPAVSGHHIHHHVHETIQPIVHKETIEPHVVHTTVPIHEVHHNAPQHHTTSALPAVSMSDFKKQGGVLGGRDERYDGFEGEPRSIGKTLGESTGIGNSSHSTPHTGPSATNTTTSDLGSKHTDPALGLGSSGLESQHRAGTSSLTDRTGTLESSSHNTIGGGNVLSHHHHNQDTIGKATSENTTSRV